MFSIALKILFFDLKFPRFLDIGNYPSFRGHNQQYKQFSIINDTFNMFISSFCLLLCIEKSFYVKNNSITTHHVKIFYVYMIFVVIVMVKDPMASWTHIFVINSMFFFITYWLKCQGTWLIILSSFSEINFLRSRTIPEYP